MPVFDPRDRLKEFSQEDWQKAARTVANNRLTLSNASVEHNWPPERMMAFLVCLEEDDLCRLYWRVYHQCEEHAVLTKPFRDGLPGAPFTCSECERDVTAQQEISFDLECVIPEAVQLPNR